MKTENNENESSSPVATAATSPLSTTTDSSPSSPSPTRRTSFTPTERQFELEELRQRSLTTQLNRHFNEQVAKETAAALQSNALRNLKQQQQPRPLFPPKTVSAHRELSPLDAVYLSITKWKRESRQTKRETMLFNQRYGARDTTTISTDAKATAITKNTQDVSPPPLEIPVSEAAQQIESVLMDYYLKTGALELPSIESLLGNDITFAHHQEQYMAALQQQLLDGNKRVDVLCTPTAKHSSANVEPDAFRDDSSSERTTAIKEDNCITLLDTEKENHPEETMGTSFHAVVTPDDATSRITTSTTITTTRMTTEEKENEDVEHTWDDSVPPGLTASSTRSTDSTTTFSFSTPPPPTTTKTASSVSTPSSPHNNRFLCVAVAVLAVGVYYYRGI